VFSGADRGHAKRLCHDAARRSVRAASPRVATAGTGEKHQFVCRAPRQAAARGLCELPPRRPQREGTGGEKEQGACRERDVTRPEHGWHLAREPTDVKQVRHRTVPRLVRVKPTGLLCWLLRFLGSLTTGRTPAGVRRGRTDPPSSRQAVRAGAPMPMPRGVRRSQAARRPSQIYLPLTTPISPRIRSLRSPMHMPLLSSGVSVPPRSSRPAATRPRTTSLYL